MNGVFFNVLAFTLLCSLTGIGTAADHLQVGDAVGAFYVSKVAGAEGDGVEVGQELCYRCRYGSRPMVIVFTREANGKLADLVKQLDATIGKHEESQLRGLIAFMGEDVAEVKDNASEFAKTSGAKHVPIVIAKETKAGPANFKLDDSAVTILLAKDSQLVSIRRGGEDQLDVSAVMRDVRQMLISGESKASSSTLSKVQLSKLKAGS